MTRRIAGCIATAIALIGPLLLLSGDGATVTPDVDTVVRGITDHADRIRCISCFVRDEEYVSPDIKTVHKGRMRLTMHWWVQSQTKIRHDRLVYQNVVGAAGPSGTAQPTTSTTKPGTPRMTTMTFDGNQFVGTIVGSLRASLVQSPSQGSLSDETVIPEWLQLGVPVLNYEPFRAVVKRRRQIQTEPDEPINGVLCKVLRYRSANSSETWWFSPSQGFVCLQHETAVDIATAPTATKWLWRVDRVDQPKPGVFVPSEVRLLVQVKRRNTAHWVWGMARRMRVTQILVNDDVDLCQLEAPLFVGTAVYTPGIQTPIETVGGDYTAARRSVEHGTPPPELLKPPA